MAKGSYKVSLNGPGLKFDRDVEEAQANAIMTYVMTGATLPAFGGGASSGGVAPPGQNPDMRGAGNTQTVKQFVAAKRPTTEYERIACLGFFLANMSDQPTFATKEIVALNTTAAQRPFSNPSQSINDTTRKYHYLSDAGGRTKQITTLGEAVVNALPEREAVKVAIAANRPPGKKKRMGKKKRKAAQ